MYNGNTYYSQRPKKDKGKNVRVGRRVVGKVKNGVFYRNIQGSRHLLRMPPAIALAVECVEQAIRYGATAIEVTDKETGRVYHSTIENFQQYSFKLQRGGFEPQLALTLERWNTVSPVHYTSRVPAKRQEWRQMDML